MLAGQGTLVCPGIACLALLLLIPAGAAIAAGTNEVAPGEPSSSSPVTDYFANWFHRVDLIRAGQPHWAPPVATTSPMLQEVFRYDVYSERLAGGRTLTSFGNSKGLEFIPGGNIQFIVGLPAWQTENTSPRKEGWADQYFLMKYRFLAANAENGDYVLTGFLGLTVPNGSANFTTHHFVFTPSAAFGKGWGDFDIQCTAGVSLPDNDSGRRTLGTPLAINTTAQYHLAKFFWPEVEVNYTWWPGGTHEGLNQAFITPGLVLGNFHVLGRVGMMVGAGCQFAMTDHALYQRNFLLTARFPF